MDEYLIFIHVLFAVLGISLNLALAGIIIFVKRLHSPRNLIWLGIGMSNIFILIGFIVEAIFSQMNSSQAWLYYMKIAGLPSGSLILNFHLSLLNRYVSIHYHSWYKAHVTNRLIITAQIVCFILFCLITKCREFFDTRCLFEQMFSTADVSEIVGFVVAILILCLTCTILMVRKTKGVRPTDNHQIHYRHQPNIENGSQAQPIVYDKIINIYFTQVGNETVSQLEMEAGRGVLISIVAFSFCVIPVMFSFGGLYICFQVSEDWFNTCSSWSRTSFYLRAVLLGAHSCICNPLLFVLFSPDMSSFLKQRCHRYR